MMDRSYLRTLPVRSMRCLLTRYGDTLNPDEIATLQQEIAYRKLVTCIKVLAVTLVVGFLGLCAWYVHF